MSLTNLSSPIATAVISIPNAYKAIVLEHSCIAELELLGTSLAYVPDGSGRHVLCYSGEIICDVDNVPDDYDYKKDWYFDFSHGFGVG